MTSFRFNIGSFNSKCDNIRTFTSKYKNISEQTFISAKSIKNSWNDVASEAFFDKVTKDEMKVSEIFNSLESYQRILEFFGSEFSNIFSSKGISTRNLTVDYNSSKVSNARRKMEIVKNHIRTAQKAFEDCSIPYGFDNLNVLNEVFNALYNDIGLLANSMENNLNDITNKIEDLISITKSKINVIPKATIDDKLSQVSANTVMLTPKKSIDINSNSKASINTTGTKSVYEIEEMNLNVEQKAVISDYENQIDIEVDVKDNNDNIVIGDVVSKTRGVQIGNLEEEKETTISETINDVSYKEKKLEEADERQINTVPKVIEANEMSLADEEVANIGTDIEKVEADDIALKSSDVENINYNAEKLDTKDIALKTLDSESEKIGTKTTTIDTKEINLQKSDNSNKIEQSTRSVDSDMSLTLNEAKTLDLNTSTSSVESTTSMSLESAKSVDIGDITSEVNSGTSVNIETGRKVDAQDILDSIK